MMSELRPPEDLPVSAEDWANTPRSVRALLLLLWRERGETSRLRIEIERLKEKVGKHSQNSSKPPSSDGPDARPRPKREPTGREAGGQPGHEGHGRRHRPSKAVQRIVVSRPTECGECGALLLGEDAHPQRHQVSEIPKVQAEITEYQLHTLTCLVCGAQTSGVWPQEMPTGAFGPRTQAMIGYLGGRFGLSERDSEELLAEGFDTEISLGSIPAQEQVVSEAIAPCVSEAQAYVRQQPAANVDETGWHEKGKRAWLWVAVTPLISVFALLTTRSALGWQTLLGKDFGGILTSDRWTAYQSFDLLRRQLCWAHLKRDFQAFLDRGGESQFVGQQLLLLLEILFALWHRVHAGTLSPPAFQTFLPSLRTQVHTWLEIGSLVDHPNTRATCLKIMQLEPALWTFVSHPDLEPTNNAAERSLRRAVLWRKRSFGTQSQAGSLFVERILTVVTSLRQQGRNVLDFLSQACHARNAAAHAPSLLPSPTI